MSPAPASFPERALGTINSVELEGMLYEKTILGEISLANTRSDKLTQVFSSYPIPTLLKFSLKGIIGHEFPFSCFCIAQLIQPLAYFPLLF